MTTDLGLGSISLGGIGLETIITIVVPVVVVLCFYLAGLANITDDQVGIKVRKLIGKQMPQGQIIARESGNVGIQADILMPKLYWLNPVIWRIKKARITVIPPGQLGVVEAIDGEELSHGRLLGDRVECNSYQDAKAFLDGHGRRGPQLEILRPGSYRINTELFTIKLEPSTVIKEEEIGIVVAKDGKPLPSGYIIAPKPVETPEMNHKFFQNGQAFIDCGGYRGPQLETLQPGEYYINSRGFEVKKVPIADVPPGYVGVLRSNIGHELAKDETRPKPILQPVEISKGPVHEHEEIVLTTDKNERGIWSEPVAPGKYNLNTLAFTVYLVPTSAVTIDWAAGQETRAEHRFGAEVPQDRRGQGVRETEGIAEEFFRFSQLRVTSMDGFQLEVDVRMVIRISPQHASFVIARFGTVANLIEQIVHPLIDSSFRNKAGEKKAIDFFMNRTALQKEALEKAQTEFEKYFVEAQNLLIAYIKIDEALLATQTNKELALQQQTQYIEQAKAQEQRIAVMEKQARAEKQPAVIDAKLSIDINRDRAEAMVAEAEGIMKKTKTIADGDSYQNEQVGKGIAKAYQAQADVIGSQTLGLLKVVEELSKGKLKVVPDVLVTGGTGTGTDATGGNLISALLAVLLQKGALTLEPTPKKDSSEAEAGKEPNTAPTPTDEKQEPSEKAQDPSKDAASTMDAQAAATPQSTPRGPLEPTEPRKSPAQSKTRARGV